jgi:metallophosphoesterase (TIGR00282 family)
VNILYIGDIMGAPGIEVVRRVLPELRKNKQIDLVIAQAENVTDGKGLSVTDFETLQQLGVDFFTGGNWSLFRPELHAYLEDMNRPVIRPANYPDGTPGRGWKYINTGQGDVLVISLLGHIVGKDAGKEIDNPLRVIDKILDENKGKQLAAIVVNFHGDYSSEKVVIGHYLDGRTTLVVGDHWHVPTADARVLPGGTAHITDVGMCGTLNSSLGVKFGAVIPRWRDNVVNKNELETDGPLQFNAVLIEVNPQTTLAKSIEQVQKIIG